ncbi:MAG: hypothetical protein NVSMB24_38360 [Mucilaginibacter sp.]
MPLSRLSFGRSSPYQSRRQSPLTFTAYRINEDEEQVQFPGGGLLPDAGYFQAIAAAYTPERDKVKQYKYLGMDS